MPSLVSHLLGEHGRAVSEELGGKHKPQTDIIMEAMDTIDAGLFTGDSFNDQWLRDQLDEMLVRWHKKLLELNQSGDDDAVKISRVTGYPVPERS